MSNEPKVILLDFADNEITDERLNAPEYMAMARDRTERIAERHDAHAIGIKDALAHAFLQGQFDMTMIDELNVGKKENPPAQVIEPDGIKSELAFGHDGSDSEIGLGSHGKAIDSKSAALGHDTTRKDH